MVDQSLNIKMKNYKKIKDRKSLRKIKYGVVHTMQSSLVFLRYPKRKSKASKSDFIPTTYTMMSKLNQEKRDRNVQQYMISVLSFLKSYRLLIIPDMLIILKQLSTSRNLNS